MQLKEWSLGKVCVRSEDSSGWWMSESGQGLFLEDTRDYEIPMRDEGLKERHTKSCLCWQERGKFIEGRVGRRYVTNGVFDCGQIFMEEV